MRDGIFPKVLRDPVWQGLGAIIGILTLILYLIVERHKIFPSQTRKAILAVIGGFGFGLPMAMIMAMFMASTVLGWTGVLLGSALVTAAFLGIIYLLHETPLRPLLEEMTHTADEGWGQVIALITALVTMMWLGLPLAEIVLSLPGLMPQNRIRSGDIMGQNWRRVVP